MNNIAESARQKRIAILLPDLRGGGVERMRIILERGFTDSGYDVDFVLMQKTGELLSELEPHVSVYDLDVTRYRNLLVPLIRFLKRERPATLLVAMWPLTSFAIWAVKLARVSTRVVISDHSILSMSPPAKGTFGTIPMRLTMWFSYRWADAIVGVSKGVVNDIAQLAGLESKTLFTIYNPSARGSVPTTPVSNPEIKPWLDASQRLIAVGTLKAVKDHVMLLNAFAGVVAVNPQASLLILGEGEMRTVMEEQIENLGLIDKVVMFGYVQDPYPYYIAADLFVLTSRYEGFGNVIVEAMECGLPVVSTDCMSGPREILEDGQFGRLVPVGDTDALTTAILATLIEAPNPERQKARASVFNVEKAAKSYLALLDPEEATASGVAVD